jgi:predicted transcriptional regulator
MIPAKEEVRQLLEQLPDDTTLEDIQYHIYVRQKIDRGLEDVAAGRMLTENEFDARMARWLEP